MEKSLSKRIAQYYAAKLFYYSCCALWLPLLGILMSCVVVAMVVGVFYLVVVKLFNISAGYSPKSYELSVILSAGMLTAICGYACILKTLTKLHGMAKDFYKRQGVCAVEQNGRKSGIRHETKAEIQDLEVQEGTADV